MATIRLNTAKSNNFAFFCPVSKLHLTLSSPVGSISKTTKAVLRGLKSDTLIDVDNVIDIETGEIKEYRKPIESGQEEISASDNSVPEEPVSDNKIPEEQVGEQVSFEDKQAQDSLDEYGASIGDIALDGIQNDEQPVQESAQEEDVNETEAISAMSMKAAPLPVAVPVEEEQPAKPKRKRSTKSTKKSTEGGEA